MSVNSMLNKEEAEQQMRRYMRQAKRYYFAVSPAGIPMLLVKDRSAIIANDDGSVTWTARAISLGAHAFIELRTGEEKTKTIYIPICLVNAEARLVAEALLNATVDPLDGRLGSKDVDVIILAADEKRVKGVKIRLSLKVLAPSYVSLQLFRQSHLLHYKSNHCWFCNAMT